MEFNLQTTSAEVRFVEAGKTTIIHNASISITTEGNTVKVTIDTRDPNPSGLTK